MNHDVYVYYDRADGEFCEAIHKMLGENGISAWIKSKDAASQDDAGKINEAISSAKCFLLPITKNNQATNQIITETDIAFSKGIPIVAFNVDGAELEGNLEFILENQEKIPSYPNTKKQLKKLVEKTCEVAGKPSGNVKLDSKIVKMFEKVNPHKWKNLAKKILAVAIPIAVILILVYLFVIVPTGQHTTSDGVFRMNITDVEVAPSDGSYIYTVHGESYNLPADSKSYFMNIKFLDADGNRIYEVNSTADEFKSGIIWSGPVKNCDADHIDFKLFDINDNMLSNETYKIH